MMLQAARRALATERQGEGGGRLLTPAPSSLTLYTCGAPVRRRHCSRARSRTAAPAATAAAVRRLALPPSAASEPQSAQSLWSRAGRAAAKLWQRVANPPLIAILVGVTIGVTPFAGALFPPEGVGATDVLDFVPPQVRLMGLAMRTAASALATLGSATLAIQAIVLGASLSSAAARLGGPPDWRPLIIASLSRFVVVRSLFRAGAGARARWRESLAWAEVE